MRVLVTGSRDWPYPELIRIELNKLLGDATLVIVEGACPAGADEYAYQWAMWARSQGFNVQSERHPADWKIHGKTAGFIRNQEMASAGADLCLAFCYSESKGTMHCVLAAQMKGIPVRLIDLGITEV